MPSYDAINMKTTRMMKIMVAERILVMNMHVLFRFRNGLSEDSRGTEGNKETMKHFTLSILLKKRRPDKGICREDENEAYS